MNKIYFQGTFGAYSHLAALSISPKAEILPCKTFDECFLKASKDSNSKIIIPESNRITGNIGIEYLIFEYRLNIYSEYLGHCNFIELKSVAFLYGLIHKREISILQSHLTFILFHALVILYTNHDQFISQTNTI